MAPDHHKPLADKASRDTGQSGQVFTASPDHRFNHERPMTASRLTCESSPLPAGHWWYTPLMEFLNATLPSDDGLWINVDRPLASRRVMQRDGFCSVLLNLEARGVKEFSHLSNLYPNGLGRLAVVPR